MDGLVVRNRIEGDQECLMGSQVDWWKQESLGREVNNQGWKVIVQRTIGPPKSSLVLAEVTWHSASLVKCQHEKVPSLRISRGSWHKLPNQIARLLEVKSVSVRGYSDTLTNAANLPRLAVVAGL